MSTSVLFNGSIPQNYEEYLTPFLFDPYADDIVARIEHKNINNVLELACGTGSVTQRLQTHFSSATKITAHTYRPTCWK